MTTFRAVQNQTRDDSSDGEVGLCNETDTDGNHKELNNHDKPTTGRIHTEDVDNVEDLHQHQTS